jgi:TolA-binding protein
VTVVGIHPEELFDKLQDSGLSVAERERLRAHLDGCGVCRFEYAARLDFQSEALELSVTSPLPSLPLRPPTLNEAESEPRAVRLTPSRRRRSRVIGWRLAAAALISASAAVASGVVGAAPWHAARLWLSQAAKANEKPAARPPKNTASAAAVRAPVVATVVSPGAEESSTALGPPAGARAVVGAEAKVGRRPEQVAKARPLAATDATSLAAAAPSSGDVSSAKDGASKEATSKESPSAAKLFGEANQARRSGDVGRASGLYHLLQDQFPGSPEAELSRVTLALLLLDNGDAQAALSGFERYLAGSSRGLEAEALVGRARALGRLGRRDLEVSAWREVQRKYPRSIYGRQATERLMALGLP